MGKKEEESGIKSIISNSRRRSGGKGGSIRS